MAASLAAAGRAVLGVERSLTGKRWRARLADDRAVAGDTRRSLSLASALVRIARLGSPARIAPLMASLLAVDDDLSARVDRLLRAGPADATSRRPRRMALAAAATAAVISLLLVVMLQPATLSSVHHLLEHLIR